MRITVFERAVTIVALIALSLFAWHGFFGADGFYERRALRNTIAQLADEHEAIRRQRRQLQERVELLHPETLDPDLADEQARRLLGYVRENELVVLLK